MQSYPIVNVDLNSWAKKYDLPIQTIINWLQKHEPECINLMSDQGHLKKKLLPKLLSSLNMGRVLGFDWVLYNELKKTQDKLNAQKKQLRSKHTLIKLQEKLNLIVKNVNDVETEIRGIDRKKRKIHEIETRYKKHTIIAQLKYNQEYQTLKTQLKERPEEKLLALKTSQIRLMNEVENAIKVLKKEWLSIETSVNSIETELTKLKEKCKTIIPTVKEDDICLSKEEIKHERTSLTSYTTEKTPQVSISFEVPWQYISFGNGSIWVRPPDRRGFQFPWSSSRSSLNIVKDLYSLRGVPNLVFKGFNDSIKGIENPEVLELVFEFLNPIPPDIQSLMQLFVAKTNRFNKAFLLSFNRRFFNRKPTFQFLLQHCSSDLPVIPLTEHVYSADRLIAIHESFLFPFIYKRQIIWIWESIEDSKATYFFKTELDYEEALFKLFSFLQLARLNKRETIIRNTSIQLELGFLKRLYHHDYRQWQDDLEYTLGKVPSK